MILVITMDVITYNIEGDLEQTLGYMKKMKKDFIFTNSKVQVQARLYVTRKDTNKILKWMKKNTPEKKTKK